MDTIDLKERIRELGHQAGAIAVGFACSGEVDRVVEEGYERWLAEGRHGEMEYLSKYREVRRDARRLLEHVPEGGTVIVLAFSYYSGEREAGRGKSRERRAVKLARYAMGSDYHDVLRGRLRGIVEVIESAGGTGRICVDTAPLMERYWAVRSGIGFVGRNGLLITREQGSWVFLAEVVTDLELPPDEPERGSCLGCGACLRHCPGGAIEEGGCVDARRCLSYLTIEKRGELSEQEEALVRRGEDGYIYGCDICQEVCPHNRGLNSGVSLAEFAPRQETATLTQEQVLGMEQAEFSRIFKGSAVKRAKLGGLQRNARIRAEKPGQ